MTGVFPSVLKTGKVFPVFKKDSKLNYSNYLAISLLSNIEIKILEKLMYSWLHTFFNYSNITYNLHFGFRQQYSRSHVLIKITENIRKSLNDENIGCGVSEYLQKVFDTLDHFGICGVSNACFKSYLSNRNLHVLINSYSSSLATIIVLPIKEFFPVPFLFLLYVNDLNQALKGSLLCWDCNLEI